MTWVLKNPDFRTVTRVVKAINRRFRNDIARARGDRFVIVDADSTIFDPSTLAARIGDLMVTPDTRARVVVNERTGTVVMGTDVKILPVIISHGSLSLSVFPDKPKREDKKKASDSSQEDEEPAEIKRLVKIGGDVTVRDVIDVLNSIGASPADLISILQAIKNAGALQGDLEII